MCVCGGGGGGSEFKPACNGVNTAWFPYIKVYGDVPQVWVMFSHLLVFIRVINSRF